LDYASGAGANGTSDGLRLTLNRDAGVTSHTPKVHLVEMAYLENPETIERYEFIIDLVKTAAVDNRDIEDVVSNIEAARDLGTLPAFRYANTATKYVKVQEVQWREALRDVGEADISTVPSSAVRRGGYLHVVVEEVIT